MCGAPTEDGTPCERHLVNQRWCQAHPGGRPTQPSYPPAQTHRAVTQAARPAPPPAHAIPRHEVRSPQPPKLDLPRAKTAVDLVNELATEGWRRTAADRLSGYLDNESAALLDRAWKASHCKKLAKAAKNLARLSGQFTALDGVLASQSARSAVSGSELATALLCRAITVHSPTATIVRGLRVSGIALCAIHGCLESCQCLKDVCEETALPQLQDLINQTCDRFLLGASGVTLTPGRP